jgi:hypothetical protein
MVLNGHQGFGVDAVDVAGVPQPWLLAPLARDHEFAHRFI